MRRFAALAPVALFVTMIVGLSLSLTVEPRRMPPMLLDRATPAFALGPIDNSQRGLSSDDLKGQVSLLNVFASWCPSCRGEHPMLLQVAHSGLVPIYGINWKDNADDAGRWLQSSKTPYIRVGYDQSGQVGQKFGVTGVPETFVVDRTGRIRFRHPGPLNPDVWRTVFEPLLAELRTER